MSHKLPKSKGQTLLIVAITAAGLVITAVIFVYAIVIGLRGQKGLSNSLCANYAAEAGVEEGILNIRNNTIPPSPGNVTVSPPITASATLADDPDDSTSWLINSTGQCQNVRRKFEVKVKKAAVDFQGNAGNYYLPYSWKEVTP